MHGEIDPVYKESRREEARCVEKVIEGDVIRVGFQYKGSDIPIHYWFSLEDAERFVEGETYTFIWTTQIFPGTELTW